MIRIQTLPAICVKLVFSRSRKKENKRSKRAGDESEFFFYNLYYRWFPHMYPSLITIPAVLSHRLGLHLVCQRQEPDSRNDRHNFPRERSRESNCSMTMINVGVASRDCLVSGRQRDRERRIVCIEVGGKAVRGCIPSSTRLRGPQTEDQMTTSIAFAESEGIACFWTEGYICGDAREEGYIKIDNNLHNAGVGKGF